jgi:hypothetical protein
VFPHHGPPAIDAHWHTAGYIPPAADNSGGSAAPAKAGLSRVSGVVIGWFIGLVVGMMMGGGGLMFWQRHRSAKLVEYVTHAP